MAGDIEKRVVIARDVAARWISRVAKPEYRIRIYHGFGEFKHMAAMLRSLRDGKAVLAGVDPVKNFGIREEFDATEVWSDNRTALVQIKEWFEKRGFETTGVW